MVVAKRLANAVADSVEVLDIAPDDTSVIVAEAVRSEISGEPNSFGNCGGNSSVLADPRLAAA